MPIADLYDFCLIAGVLLNKLPTDFEQLPPSEGFTQHRGLAESLWQAVASITLRTQMKRFGVSTLPQARRKVGLRDWRQVEQHRNLHSRSAASPYQYWLPSAWLR